MPREMTALQVFMLSVMLAETAACMPALATSASATTAELVGCYRWETERGWSSLRLRPDGQYVAYTTVGLGLLAKASGGWALEDGELGLSPSNEVRNWFEQAGAPIVVSRDARGTIALTGALGEFTRTPYDITCGP